MFPESPSGVLGLDPWGCPRYPSRRPKADLWAEGPKGNQRKRKMTKEAKSLISIVSAFQCSSDYFCNVSSFRRISETSVRLRKVRCFWGF